MNTLYQDLLSLCDSTEAFYFVDQKMDEEKFMI